MYIYRSCRLQQSFFPQAQMLTYTDNDCLLHHNWKYAIDMTPLTLCCFLLPFLTKSSRQRAQRNTITDWRSPSKVKVPIRHALWTRFYFIKTFPPFFYTPLIAKAAASIFGLFFHWASATHGDMTDTYYIWRWFFFLKCLHPLLCVSIVKRKLSYANFSQKPCRSPSTHACVRHAQFGSLILTIGCWAGFNQPQKGFIPILSHLLTVKCGSSSHLVVVTWAVQQPNQGTWLWCYSLFIQIWPQSYQVCYH